MLTRAAPLVHQRYKTIDALKVPYRYWVLLGAFVFSAILPSILSYPIQLILLTLSFFDWFHRRTVRRGLITSVFAITIIVYWAALLIHPNVPSLEIGILGFRKSALAVAGVLLGASVPETHRQSFVRVIVFLMSAAVVISIVGHFLFPDLLRSLRGASDTDIYTTMFRGQIRMQGVFAGPFHAAMAGGFLVCWALAYWKDYKWLPKAVLAIGLICIYLTLVRTSYVALGGIIIAFILMSSGITSKAQKIGAIAVIGAAGLAAQLWLGFELFDIASTIGEAGSDSRFLNRFNDYQYAWDAFEQSPLVGWGAGSAGDVLAYAFESGVHVTSHNMGFKMLVEGGAIGASLWMVFLISAVLETDRTIAVGKFGLSSLLFMLFMGLTGSSIEALPVTFFICVALGLGLRNRRVAVPLSTDVHNKMRSS